MSAEPWDVVVVGGGPAGLSGALWLARYQRRVLLLDDGHPRNEAAWAVHGFPGLEDPEPTELRRRIARQARDAGAVLQTRRADGISGRKDAFRVTDEEGRSLGARRVLLAYGRSDRIPELPGLHERYGTSVFHCPDCDGPSVADRTVGVLGHDRSAAALALYLLTWARQSVLLTDGLEPELDDEALGTLDEYDVHVETRAVDRLEGPGRRLERAVLQGGSVALDALFFHWGSDPASALGPASGCDVDDAGHLVADSALETSVPGIYAAGDIIGHPHLAISAAAGGVRAALAIHRSLLPSAFQL
jgi:thioredoxin reductase